VLIVPDKHPLARRKRVAFADTVAFPYVGLHTGSAINRALERASLEAQQPLRLRIQVTSFDALSRMVEAGLGIGLMPSSFAQPLARSLGIRVVALAEPWTRRRLVLCMRSYAGLPIAARLLVDALRAAPAGAG
jgi:DNA-binding transcriptional LysR family regulator